MSDVKQSETREYVNVSGRLQRDAAGKDWKPLATASLDPDSHYAKGLLAYGYIRPAPAKALTTPVATESPAAPPAGPALAVSVAPLASTASAPDVTTAAPAPTPAGAGDPIPDVAPAPAAPVDQATTNTSTKSTTKGGK